MDGKQPAQPLTDAELADIERRADITDSVEYVCDEGTMSDLRRLLAEVHMIRAEVSGYRAAICFETTCTGCAGLLDQMVKLEAENAAARELHKPRHSALHYVHCASGCGAGPLQGPDPYPCDTAEALGMDQSGEGRANGLRTWDQIVTEAGESRPSGTMGIPEEDLDR